MSMQPADRRVPPPLRAVILMILMPLAVLVLQRMSAASNSEFALDGSTARLALAAMFGLGLLHHESYWARPDKGMEGRGWHRLATYGFAALVVWTLLVLSYAENENVAAGVLCLVPALLFAVFAVFIGRRRKSRDSHYTLSAAPTLRMRAWPPFAVLAVAIAAMLITNSVLWAAWLAALAGYALPPLHSHSPDKRGWVAAMARARTVLAAVLAAASGYFVFAGS